MAPEPVLKHETERDPFNKWSYVSIWRWENEIRSTMKLHIHLEMRGLQVTTTVGDDDIFVKRLGPMFSTWRQIMVENSFLLAVVGWGRWWRRCRGWRSWRSCGRKWNPSSRWVQSTNWDPLEWIQHSNLQTVLSWSGKGIWVGGGYYINKERGIETERREQSA